MSALLLTWLALSAATPREAPEHVWDASIQVLSLLNHGLEIQGERYLGDSRFSVIAAAGAHAETGGDYSGLHASVSGEFRAYLWRPGSWSRIDGRRRGGLLAFARLDLGYDSLFLRNTALGHAFALQPVLGVGWKFLPGGGHVQLTPWAGAAYDVRFPGLGSRIPSRAVAVVGGTVGWLF